MSDPFLSEIRLVSFGFAPTGWAMCDGQLLPINQNQALYALVGTYYGGDGRANFALPNLQDRAPLHTGNRFTLGQGGGQQNVALTAAEIPAHTHAAQASTGSASTGSPSGAYWANGGEAAYGSGTASALQADALANAGASQPHPNMPPYLVLNFVIALQGIFPSQN